ncbi:arginase [Geomicrobium sp. JSM 1781026]|uniref:arginase n=1 Tax=Geomicrobium sp. JSM 1781026 TaxID=3344580 RepID=UPI0035C19678
MNRTISVLGAPLDLGQNRRGVDMGPSAIRYAGAIERLEALGYEVNDDGDIVVERSIKENQENLKHLSAVQAANETLKTSLHQIVGNGHFPLVFGGDHSIAMGTLAGITPHYDELGVIWYDAHGDLNTDKTSPSGNIHGMPLAAAIGHGHSSLTSLFDGQHVKERNIVLIGVRALDEAEKAFLKTSAITVFTMHEVDRLGMSEVMTRALQTLEHCDGIHLSLDLDGLDPIDAPGVGTPVTGGLTYRESHLAMEMLAESERVTSCEFVEVNPILDEQNKTAEAAVALMGSLFGEKLK